MAIKTGTRILTSQKYQEELKSYFHNKQKKQKIVRRKQPAPENEKRRKGNETQVCHRN